jgi:DNA invertase Pin-like site-specific DNA recombinase
MSSPFPPGSYIFAYLRDSGHEEQDLSISQQETEIRLWAQANNLVVTRFYKDEARRGSSDVGRDDLHAMMNAFRHGCSERGVVVWKYNRFARNMDNAQFYRAEIRSRGYIFHSLNDQIPDGPAGRIFEALIDYKDEQYLTDLSIDVKRGLRDLVHVHGCVPSVPPRGFRRIPVTLGLRRDGAPHIAHRWEPDPETAPLVLKAFEMRAAGASLGAIQAETHLYGGVNSYRTFWPNKLYIGILEYGGLVIEHYCEPIVPLPLWEAVQKIQGDYRGHHHVHAGSPHHPRRRNSRFLLSGLARCGRCGSPLYGHSSPQKNRKTLDSYFCTRAWRNRDCVRTRIPRQPLESHVLATLTDYILLPDTMENIRTILTESQAARLAEQDHQRESLASQLRNVRRQIRHVTDAIAQRSASKALLDRLSELEKHETELLTRQAELETTALQPIPTIDPNQLPALIELLRSRLPALPVETQRQLLHAFIDHVDVEREGNTLRGIIYYYYPPPDLKKAFPPPESGGTETVSLSLYPSGPPRYRHSIPLPFTAPIKKRP